MPSNKPNRRAAGTQPRPPGDRKKWRAKRSKSVMACTMSVVALMHRLIPGRATVATPAFHYEIQQRLMDLSIKRFNVVAPRAHAKSSLVSLAFVIWHLFFEDAWIWIHRVKRLKKKGVPRSEWPAAPFPIDPKGWRKPKYVVLVSKTEGVAKERLLDLKWTLGDMASGRFSAPLRKLLGNWGEQSAIRWTETQLVLKDGSKVLAMGSGQQGHGLNQAGQRPTLIVVDDPETETNTRTAESIQFNIRWLFTSMLPALDPKVGRLVVIGTPITTQSMVVQLHKAFSQGEKIKVGEDVEAIDQADGPKSDSLWFENDEATNTSRWSVSPKGEVVLGSDEELEEDESATGDTLRWIRKKGVLWPEWCSLSWLRDRKQICDTTEGVGLGIYYRQYECKVIGDDEQTFRPEFFDWTWFGSLDWDSLGNPYIYVTHRRGKELVDEEGNPSPERIPCGVSTGVDPAFSTNKSADKTAIVNGACAIGPDGKDEIYELPGIHRRLHPANLLDAIEANHERVKPNRGMIEANGPQKFVAEQLRAERQIMYVPDPARQAKKGEGSRIAGLHTYMEPREVKGEGPRSRFWHWGGPEGSPLKPQLLLYPRGRDDYADATEKMVRVRARPFHDRVVMDSELELFEPVTGYDVDDPMLA